MDIVLSPGIIIGSGQREDEFHVRLRIPDAFDALINTSFAWFVFSASQVVGGTSFAR